MRGSIVQRNGHYSIVLDEGRDPETGKRRQRWISVKGNKHEADRQLAELLNQVNNGTFLKPAKQTVKDYLESWLRDSALPNMTPRTYEGYEFNVRKYLISAIGNIHLTELKSQHIQHLIGEIQAAGHYRTAQYCFNTLNKSLSVAVKMGALSRNPVDGVEAPQVPRHEMQTMSESDLHIFLEYARESPYYALFYTDLFTGMRRSEALALQWKDTDTDLLLPQISVNRTMHVMRYGTYKGQLIFKQPKTAKSRRSIALTPSNAIVLREYREAQNKQRISLGLPELTDNDLVFCQWDGKPYQPDAISHAWMKLVRRCGLKGIRLHDARHTMASLWLKMGIHPKIVQERLGHATINTTLDLYSHVAPGLQAAAANQFDEVLQSKENKLDRELKELVR